MRAQPLPFAIIGVGKGARATFWWALGQPARWLKTDTARPRGASNVMAALSWPLWLSKTNVACRNGVGNVAAVLGRALWWDLSQHLRWRWTTRYGGTRLTPAPK